VAVDAEIEQPALQALHELRIVLYGLAAGNELRGSNQLELLRVMLRISSDIAEQIGAIGGHVFIDEDDEAMGLFGSLRDKASQNAALPMPNRRSVK